MNLYGLTDIGLVRRNNQDSYAIRELDDSLAVAVVCDGMGGAQAGNVASAVAVEAFSSAMENACKDGVPPDCERKQELLRAACRSANTQVFELSRGNDEYYGMGTTLVGAMMLSHEVYVINVGDSRCYILSDGALTQITSDHSLVQALVDCGDITQEEARNHPQKNFITRALGVEDSVRSDVFSVEYKKGDILLLCTDGLTNTVTDEVLQTELSQPTDLEETARKLLALAIEQGAPDNVTVVLAQL
jgi:protein phosphatase